MSFTVLTIICRDIRFLHRVVWQVDANSSFWTGDENRYENRPFFYCCFSHVKTILTKISKSNHINDAIRCYNMLSLIPHAIADISCYLWYHMPSLILPGITDITCYHVYYMASLLSHAITDIIWYYWYPMLSHAVTDNTWNYWYHMLSHAITDIAWYYRYHMLSLILYGVTYVTCYLF